MTPLCMVTEFCERGNLFDLLHNRAISLSWSLRKKMALDAAKGMSCTCMPAVECRWHRWHRTHWF